MLHFLGFILIIALIFILFIVVGVLGIFRAMFGRKFKKTVQRRSQPTSEPNEPRTKVFDDNEGEYVDFEEVDETDSTK